jgi:hypothetical protein
MNIQIRCRTEDNCSHNEAFMSIYYLIDDEVAEINNWREEAVLQRGVMKATLPKEEKV